jgi:hypothetical protein
MNHISFRFLQYQSILTVNPFLCCALRRSRQHTFSNTIQWKWIVCLIPVDFLCGTQPRGLETTIHDVTRHNKTRHQRGQNITNTAKSNIPVSYKNVPVSCIYGKTLVRISSGRIVILDEYFSGLLCFSRHIFGQYVKLVIVPQDKPFELQHLIRKPRTSTMLTSLTH